jgi:SnoaL-like domain
MHANAVLLQQLFNGLNHHDHHKMAACYHLDATFQDIAFDLRGRKQIHAMWHMICDGDIRATFDVVDADDHSGQVKLVDDYTFSSTGRAVHNIIDSHFRFRSGLIVEHHDHCDPRAWASMALGGISGFFAGRLQFLRSRKAKEMLEKFIEHHRQYR